MRTLTTLMIEYHGPNELTKDLVYDRLVHNLPSAIGFDVETISLSERLPIGFSIATSPDEAFYFRTHPEMDYEEIEQLAKPVLRNPDITKVIHNALFDLKCIPLVFDIDTTNIADTNVAARLLGYFYTSLEDLAPIVGKTAWSAKSMGIGKNKTMLDLPPAEVSKKCCYDTRATLGLYNSFWPKAVDFVGQEYMDVEMKVIPILVSMGLRGVWINQIEREKFESEYESHMASYAADAREIAGHDFSPGSPSQVGYILAKRGNFLPITKSGKQLSTRKGELDFLSDPLAAVILHFRHYRDALSKYIYPWAKVDRMYTNYSMDVSVGRLSSSDFNLQNIPKELRIILMPDNGVFTSGDYSQEHLRILAHFSSDPLLNQVYTEGAMGGDIHKYTAAQLNISRAIARNVNYAIPYGGTPKTVQMQTKIADIRKCAYFLQSWKELFVGATRWLNEAMTVGISDGWSLPTLFGRRIKIPEENIEGMSTKAVNYPILGSDGEVIKRALICCSEHKLPLAITVHDSISCDGPVEFPIGELEHLASPLHLPFEVKQSLRWE